VGQVRVAMDILQDSYQISATVRSHESVTCRGHFASDGLQSGEDVAPAGRRASYAVRCASSIAGMGAGRLGASHLQRGRVDILLRLKAEDSSYPRPVKEASR
jgi:hypothetical protein